jgi:phosphomannomutase/phosphoglucomutase
MIDLRVLVPLAGATLMLLGGVFFAWQTWQAIRLDDPMACSLLRAVRSAKALAVVVEGTRDARAGSLASDAVVTPLRADAGEAARAARSGNPASVARCTDVQVLQPGSAGGAGCGLRQFGYAKALAADQGARRGSAPMQTLPSGKDRGCSTRCRADQGQRTGAGHCLDRAAAGCGEGGIPLRPPEDGKLELRQGDYGGVILESLGSGAWANWMSTASMCPAVCSTSFHAPRCLGRRSVNPWLYGVLRCWLRLRVFMLWLRKVGLEAGLARLNLRIKERSITRHSPTPSRTWPATKAPARLAWRAAQRGVPAPAPVAPKPRQAIRADRGRPQHLSALTTSVVSWASSSAVEVAHQIGRAVGSEVIDRGLHEVVVGRDGRLSVRTMVAGLVAGLRESGCDVIDIGMVPTPVVYYATFHLNTGSGIAVTGSHNPPTTTASRS